MHTTFTIPKDLLIFIFVYVSCITSASFQAVDSTEIYMPDFEIDPHPVDPEGCLRNREEAAARGRQCLRKCTSDADCISSRKRCLCDGLCGWSCIRPDLHCDELAALDHGDFKLTGDHFGAKVMYTCDDGYWMSGPKERVCQGDGSWSEHGPECRQRAMCGIPQQVPHARHNATEDNLEFDVESVIQYQCFQGYDAHGYPRAKCLFSNGTTQWFGLDLRCIPRSCGHPGEIENGHREGDIFVFTSRVTYHCDEGYELVGRANRYCQSKGEWSGVLPSCRPVQCPVPMDVSNGRVVYSASTFKSIARYECLYGYRLVGPITRACGANKQWEGSEPYCEEIDCGNPGILHNGYLKGSSTRFSSVITYSCLENMTFVGTSNSTSCQEDGTWSHSVPKCMAPCPVPEVEHGRVNDYAPDAKVGHDKQIRVDCIPQYELRYNNTPATCNNGSWTHVPTCIPARCKTLPRRPRDGMVIAPKTDHGMKALYRCKDGFKLTGPNVTECSFGRWSGDTPVCNKTYCPFPGVVANGRVLLIGYMGMYDYRPYVRKVADNRQIMYECDRHYTLKDGPPGATCVDGKWSPPELPECIRGSHPQVRLNRSLRDRRETAVRKQRRIRKDRNWNRRKNSRKQGEYCKPLKTTPWMEVRILRKKPSRTELANNEENNSMVPRGTVVKVVCGWGHVSNIGNRTARCARGKWKPKEPECSTSPCIVPLTSYGTFHHFGNIVDVESAVNHSEVVTLSCDKGFQIMGAETLRCWYGEWAVNKMPECLPGPCELDEVPHGSYFDGYRSGLTISHGSVIRYKCDAGFVKDTSEPVICNQGKLIPELPKCLPITVFTKGYELAAAAELRSEPVHPSEALLTSPESSIQPCTLPERLHNTLLYRGSTFVEPNDSNDLYSVTRNLFGRWEKLPSGQETRYFPNGTQVLFKCLAAVKTGKKTTWKIICQDGVWVGRPHQCDSKSPNPPSFARNRNKPCLFYRPHPDVVAFVKDRKLNVDVAKLAPGTELIYRCIDIGKYKIEGSPRRRCVGGQWTGTEPVCYGLSQEYDYALEKAPTILFRHQIGQIAQSNDGKLIVYPGTILHLECLWIRKYGTPHWEVSHSNRKYPEGWTNEPGRDSQLEYRLSIYHVKTEDSGLFTCVTPMGHEHAVEIVVSAIHCKPIIRTNGLMLSTSVTKMNVKLVFSCELGYKLIGSEQATCHPSGQWSAKPAVCQKVVLCPYPGSTRGATISNVKFYYEVGETIVFGCKEGYKVQGRTVLQCLDGGRWSSTIPTCHPVKKYLLNAN